MPRRFSETGDGVSLRVRLTPRGGRDRIEGWDAEGQLRVRVASPPVDGAANEALIGLVAKTLGVPKSAVAIAAGATARAKTLRLAGDPADLAARIRASLP